MFNEIFGFNFVFSGELKDLSKALFYILKAFWIKVELVARMLNFTFRLAKGNRRLIEKFKCIAKAFVAISDMADIGSELFCVTDQSACIVT